MALAIKAAVLYFAIVFGAGFILGAIRTLLIVPRIGARTAELIEAPIMIAISFLVAAWAVSTLSVPAVLSCRAIMGAIALILMFIAEFVLMKLRGMSLREYFATRDPVASSVYYFALLLFAMAPILVRR